LFYVEERELLMSLPVYREGVQSLGYARKINEARVRVEYGQVEIVFTSNPEGERNSRFELVVQPTSFTNLVEAMMRANSRKPSSHSVQP
jgi:hypothetical protein